MIFLGFGYDARSVKRLDLSNHVPDRTVFGTAYLLPPADRGNAEALFGYQRINFGKEGNPIIDYFDVFYEIKAEERQRRAEQQREELSPEPIGVL